MPIVEKYFSLKLIDRSIYLPIYDDKSMPISSKLECKCICCFSETNVTADDVVPYKHGEKSAEVLRSAGYRNLSFRSYNGYVYMYVCML